MLLCYQSYDEHLPSQSTKYNGIQILFKNTNYEYRNEIFTFSFVEYTYSLKN